MSFGNPAMFAVESLTLTRRNESHCRRFRRCHTDSEHQQGNNARFTTLSFPLLHGGAFRLFCAPQCNDKVILGPARCAGSRQNRFWLPNDKNDPAMMSSTIDADVLRRTAQWHCISDRAKR